jgi:hypothetical protein
MLLVLVPWLSLMPSARPSLSLALSLVPSLSRPQPVALRGHALGVALGMVP